MKHIPLRLLLIAAVAAPVAMASPSLAQDQAPPAAAPDGAHAHHWQKPDPAAMAARHAQHLRDALQLRPDQDAALNTFVQAMAPPEHKDGMGWDHKEGAMAEPKAMTTPERLDHMAAMMDKRRAEFTARAEATKAFYAQLSPAQQKAFDLMADHMMGEHGPGGRGHGHMGGHPPMGGPGAEPGEHPGA